MSLRERLRLMKAAGTSHPPAPPDAAEVEGASGSEWTPDIPGARQIPTDAGPATCIERIYSPDTLWGTVGIANGLRVPALGLRRILKGTLPAASESLQEAVFIDTETTGLERGTGTCAFLIGVGRFVQDGLRVRQFLMRDYNEEGPVLHAVLQEMQGATLMVTFNGKTFDWPLLQTRAVLNRMRLPELPHLDLLHPARRLWSEVVPSCRLVQLEADILGYHREGDVPSELIPHIYFNFVRTGDPEHLLPVLHHNQLDIVTTVALAGYIGSAFASPLNAAPTGHPLSGAELYGVGRLLAAQEETEESIRCLEAALDRDLPAGLRAGCMELLGILLKLTKQHRRAVTVWECMVAEGLRPIEACVELAKYYEHVTKEFETAKKWTMVAIDTLERRRLLRGLRQEPMEGTANQMAYALIHRLERIESKLRQRVV